MERLSKSGSYDDELGGGYSAPIPSLHSEASSGSFPEDDRVNDDSTRKLKHLSTVWDYQQLYGGEMYTVRWESRLLEELCDSVVDLAADVVTGSTSLILRHTALATLMAAVALPVALTTFANMIDETWTLVVERADAAGRELAQSLLFSRAGNRPVTLVGFSFGARVIYSCLKELARLQEEWEAFHLARVQGAEQKPKTRRERRRSSTTSQRGDDSEAISNFEKMREPASIVHDVSLCNLVFSFLISPILSRRS
jgi:hypothetical protein